jgi:glyoxylase-like metal-dependent hydrolase (beta-lactamase superfamily II)
LKNNHDVKITVWGEKGFHSYMSDLLSVRKLNAGESFDPPEFGVTVLGASHGFDPNGSTSGLIIWINGSGIMVDPPPFAMTYLKDRGISSILIKGIIISHCHADHDAGTFHKVLDHNKVEIITTKTIMRSFIKKYSALSRIPPENLE